MHRSKSNARSHSVIPGILLVVCICLLGLSASAQSQSPRHEANPSSTAPLPQPVKQAADNNSIQEHDVESVEQLKIEERERELSEVNTEMDMPALRAAYFRRGRAVLGENSAELLHRAFRQKQQMLDQMETTRADLAAGPNAQIAAPHLAAAAAFSNLTWTSLGPAPMISDPSGGQSYGFVSGRVTAMDIDQNDTSGNTVYVGGAFGGLWKSTNAASVNAANVTWTQLLDGQVTEAVGAVSVQPPGGSGVILVGTGEPNSAGDSYYGQGILRSTNGGATWTQIASADGGVHPFRGGGFSRFAWSTANANLVVAAFANVGISFGGTQSGYTIGIYYSQNAGSTWQLATVTDNGTPISPGSVRDVIYDPKFGANGTFFAFIRFHGIYSSTDGINWARLPDANQPGTAMSAANCPAVTNSTTCPLSRGTFGVRSDNGEMYLVWVNNSNSLGAGSQGIYKATANPAAGGTWAQMGETGFTSCGDSSGCGYYQSFYNIYIAAIPNAANSANTDVYMAFGNIFKCTATAADPTCSSTATWVNLTHVYGSCPSNYGVHPDQHAIAISNGTPSTIYFGNDGGVYRTLAGNTLSDAACGSTQFQNLNQNIGSMSEFVSFSQHPTDPGTVLGGLQDNGSPMIFPSLTTPSTLTWQSTAGGDGGFNAIDPSNTNNLYTSTPNTTSTGIRIRKCTGGTNCGASQFASTIISGGSIGDYSLFYYPYILDPQLSSSLLLGTCRVWRLPTNGSTIMPSMAISNNFSVPTNTSCLSSDTSLNVVAAGGPTTANGSQVMYAGMSGGAHNGGHVFVTTSADSGTGSWTDVTVPSGGTSINPGSFPISDIYVDPTVINGQTAYITIQGFLGGGSHIWKTTNAGTNWTSLNGDLPDVPVDSISLDPGTGYLFVGTDIGVFVSTNGGTNWAPYGTGLPSVPALHVRTFINGNTRLLRAATYGRGVWSIPLPSIGGINISSNTLSMSNLPGFTQTQGITYNNTSGGTITISSIQVSGSTFSTNNNCNGSVANNATCAINILFTPAAVSNYSGTLTITDNAAGSPRTISLAGNGVALTITNTRVVRSHLGSTSTFIAAGSSVALDMTIGPSGLIDTASAMPQVALSCTGAPRGATCSVQPVSIQLGNGPVPFQVALQTSKPKRSKRLAVGRRVTDGTPPGMFTLKVTATWAGYSHTLDVPVTVQ